MKTVNKVISYGNKPETDKIMKRLLSQDDIEYHVVCDETILNKILTQGNVGLLLIRLFSENDVDRSLTRLRLLRQITSAPILIIADNDKIEYKILALENGADDYICDSMHILELYARIKSHIRRFTQLTSYKQVLLSKTPSAKDENEQKNSPLIYQVRDLTLDDESKRVFIGEFEENLTPIEYKILKLLISYQGRPVSSKKIYSEIWHMQAVDTDNVIAVHIRHIRKKIEKNPQEPSYLKVVRGMGYMIA